MMDAFLLGLVCAVGLVASYVLIFDVVLGSDASTGEKIHQFIGILIICLLPVWLLILLAGVWTAVWAIRHRQSPILA